MSPRLAKLYLLAGCVLAFLASGPRSQAQIGGQIVSDGTQACVTILPADAGFTSDVLSVLPGGGGTINLGANHGGVGQMTALPVLPAGTVMDFRIYVRNTNQTLVMGPGSGNPDGIAHANLIQVGPGDYVVGFEDFPGGGDRDYNDVMFEVVFDHTAPTISNASVDKSVLWSPNHQMVDITVSYSVSDDCDPNPTASLTVTSNEPDNGLGDGDTAGDIQVIDSHHVRLRAERSGKGSGRIYTITITATDASGNSSTQTVTVSVPHDKK